MSKGSETLQFFVGLRAIIFRSVDGLQVLLKFE